MTEYKAEVCERCNGHGVIWGVRGIRGDEECVECEGEGMIYESEGDE